MASPYALKSQMVEIGQRLARQGYIAGVDGNISVRLDSDRILITPSGLAKGRLTPDDLVVVDNHGKKLQGNLSPSSEMPMHLFVLERRSEVTACVHAHPPYATAFAVSGKRLADNVLPEVVLTIGSIPLTDYAPPGTDAVPRSLEPYVDNHHAFLLRNHGVLTTGRSLEEAYNRLETVEHYAKILFLALQLGNVNHIPTEDFKRLDDLRRKLEQLSGDRP
ncbi:MAG TPA: class II aldolase/adducin family protein [Candidatus Acidoferrum sp.]|nr:class II aldolase/adducin family protein [Candidatus Acidoferrum sp.]